MNTLVFAACATLLLGLIAVLAVNSVNRGYDRADRRKRHGDRLTLDRLKFNAEYALKRAEIGHWPVTAKLPDGA